MRVSALAATMGMALATLSAPLAHAETWIDPAGRLIFEMPRGWSESIEARQTDNYTAVSIFDPNHDCSIVAQPNDSTKNLSATRVRDAVLEEDRWTEQNLLTYTEAFPGMFNGTQPELLSHSIETPGSWPIVRMEFRAGGKSIYGAAQLRPGIDMWAMCSIYSGQDSAATYDAFFRSMGAPADAQWRTELEPASTTTPALAPATP